MKHLTARTHTELELTTGSTVSCLLFQYSPVDGGDELLPPDPEGLHGVLGVSVLEDEALLDLLVDPLQLLEVRLELVDGLLVLAEPGKLVLKGTLEKKKNIYSVSNLAYFY